METKQLCQCGCGHTVACDKCGKTGECGSTCECGGKMCCQHPEGEKECHCNC